MNDSQFETRRDRICERLASFLRGHCGRSPASTTTREHWLALSRTVLEDLADDWEQTRKQYRETRQTHYFSAEYLTGRALHNNLSNLGLLEAASAALAAIGRNLEDLEETEPDAGLGNGGLGRLAACFLDSAATLNLPVTGYGLLYRYGLFRQEIQDGFQRELPDEWREKGYPWLVRREEEAITIRMADMEVRAIPYDMPITGFGTRNVNTLRLWRPEPVLEFDFRLFNDQRFDEAVRNRNRVDDIWRVLYPNDTNPEGKMLRLRQQYFFSAASLQDILRDHAWRYGGDFRSFARWHRIQLNDTHPVVAIPELLRSLTNDWGLDEDAAFGIVRATFAFTNHTLMSEAMESWDLGLFGAVLPDLMPVVLRLDERFRRDMEALGRPADEIARMAPIGDGRLRMANLALFASDSVNGVAALHTKLLRDSVLADWNRLWPERFRNKTNGVTPRRWLYGANPELAAMLSGLSGGTEWVTDLDRLAALVPLADDPSVRQWFLRIKETKKKQLSDWLLQSQGIRIDPAAMFDVQIKRLHEYKRQLLNALAILELYFRIKDHPCMAVSPTVFLFGAKAAPGYFRAKATIKLINEIARLVNGDPDVAGRIQVHFLPNYRVSLAERIFPAADVSEQISMAGKEASGTGNMKFMMNGALTLGTYDGANVEIVEAVGEDSAFIFGARVEHFPGIFSVYTPRWQYEHVPGLKRTLDALVDGTLDDGGTGMFRDLYVSLLDGVDWQRPDPYYVLGDFEGYRKTRAHVDEAYANRPEWARRCLRNIFLSGRFSSDRTIRDYVEDIWRIEPSPIEPVSPRIGCLTP